MYRAVRPLVRPANFDITICQNNLIEEEINQ